MKKRVIDGVLAGMAAATACGIVALVATATGESPEFNPPALLGRFLGTRPSVVAGWLAHFLVYGGLLGSLFGLLGRRLSDLGYGLSGLFSGLVTFGAVGLVFMPLAGAGVFGLNLGYSTIPVMLVAHLAFGFTLGATYARLARADRDGLLAA